MKKILFVITLLLISISNVNAEPCDAYDIKRLKEIAEGIEITYELQDPVELDYGKIMDSYKINIIGLTEELSVVNETDQKFYYYNTNYNELEVLSSGKKVFIIKSKDCSRDLRKISLKLPVYNGYHSMDICQENSDLSICQEWVEEPIEESQIFDLINKEDFLDEQTDSIINNNIKIIILFSIIFVFIIIIVIVVRKKRSVLQ